MVNPVVYRLLPKRGSLLEYCTVGHENHDSCFHKKYIEAGVMTFCGPLLYMIAAYYEFKSQ